MATSTRKLHREYDDNGVLVNKECRKCGTIKPITEFYRNGNKGKTNIDGYQNFCIVCHKTKWHQRAQNPENRKRWLLERIRSKCNKNDIPFDLTIEDLAIPERCPVLGIPLKFGVKTDSVFRNKRGVEVPYDSPSVDRIIPEKGYVKGNIIIVSYRANMLKGDASLEEIVALSDFYKQFL